MTGWVGRSAKEQDDLLRQIAKHQYANKAYLDEGVRSLKLSQNVVFFTISKKCEKRGDCLILCIRTRSGRMTG